MPRALALGLAACAGGALGASWRSWLGAEAFVPARPSPSATRPRRRREPDCGGGRGGTAWRSGLAAPGVEAAVVEAPAAEPRPAKLLRSDGARYLVRVLSRLRDVPGRCRDDEEEGGYLGSRAADNTSALDCLVANFVEWLQLDVDVRVPPRLEEDFLRAARSVPLLQRAASESAPGAAAWLAPLREFAGWRIARRLPEVVDNLLPWDIIYPDLLASQSGVPLYQVRGSLREFLSAANWTEVAEWSEAEVEAAVALLQRDAAALVALNSALEARLSGGWLEAAALVAEGSLVFLHCEVAFELACMQAESMRPADFAVFAYGLLAAAIVLWRAHLEDGGAVPDVPFLEQQVVPLYKLVGLGDL